MTDPTGIAGTRHERTAYRLGRPGYDPSTTSARLLQANTPSRASRPFENLASPPNPTGRQPPDRPREFSVRLNDLVHSLAADAEQLRDFLSTDQCFGHAAFQITIVDRQ
jgi:hypothetical protein